MRFILRSSLLILVTAGSLFFAQSSAEKTDKDKNVAPPAPPAKGSSQKLPTAAKPQPAQQQNQPAQPQQGQRQLQTNIPQTNDPLPPDLTRDPKSGFLISKPNPYNTPNIGTPGSVSNNLFGQPPGTNPNQPANAPSTPGSVSNNLSGQTSTNSLATPGSISNNLGAGRQPSSDSTSQSSAAHTRSKSSTTLTNSSLPHTNTSSVNTTTSTAATSTTGAGSTMSYSYGSAHSSANLVDLNTASADEINAVFGANMGAQVIKGRPYQTVSDLITRGLVSQQAYTAAKSKITVNGTASSTTHK